MREQFPGYVRPKADALREWLRTGTIALDANVLLGIYRLTAETRNELFAVLESVEDRLWVPHQAALEFHRNRPSVILEQQTSAEQLRSVVADAANRMIDELGKWGGKRNREGVRDQLLTVAQNRLDDLREELLTLEREHFVALGGEDLLDADPIYDRIERLLSGRIGSEYAEDDLDALYKEADSRYAAKIPPGYSDREKSPPERYGDFVLWRQLVDEARRRKAAVVFVSADAKEDWVWEAKGRAIGPRAELVAEMYALAGVPFHRYTTAAFVQRAKESLGGDVSDQALDELRDAEQGARRKWRLKDAAELFASGALFAALPADERAAALDAIKTGGAYAIAFHLPRPDGFRLAVRIWAQAPVRVFCRVTHERGEDRIAPRSLQAGPSFQIHSLTFPDDFLLAASAPPGSWKVEWAIAGIGDEPGWNIVATDEFFWEPPADRLGDLGL